MTRPSQAQAKKRGVDRRRERWARDDRRDRFLGRAARPRAQRLQRRSTASRSTASAVSLAPCERRPPPRPTLVRFSIATNGSHAACAPRGSRARSRARSTASAVDAPQKTTMRLSRPFAMRRMLVEQRRRCPDATRSRTRARDGCRADAARGAGRRPVPRREASARHRRRRRDARKRDDGARCRRRVQRVSASAVRTTGIGRSRPGSGRPAAPARHRRRRRRGRRSRRLDDRRSRRAFQLASRARSAPVTGWLGRAPFALQAAQDVDVVTHARDPARRGRAASGGRRR